MRLALVWERDEELFPQVPLVPSVPVPDTQPALEEEGGLRTDLLLKG